MNTCTQCLNEYESKRKTSKYCSPSCRSKARHKPVSVQDDEVSVQVSVTPKFEYHGKHKPFDFCPKHQAFYSSCGC